MNDWVSRSVCPKCASNYECTFGEAFFTKHNGCHISCCPKCSEPRPSMWKVERFRWISTATWNPMTWSNGHWESKKVLNVLGME